MGCGSSAGQVIDSKESIFKLQQILIMSQQKDQNIANGRIFLFGETRTQRKVIECQTKLNTVKVLSAKTRIPCPKIVLDPLEAMYEESQQVFNLGMYGLSMLPPFNKMLTLYLQTNVIFMCGGRDYDHYNVKNEVFFYSVEDIKIMGQMSHSNEVSPRTLYRPKYSRNRYQKMPSMSKCRYSHMGMYCNKLKSVLVFGGRNQKEEILASCQIYNLFQNAWKDIPSMSVPRADGHCFEYAGKIYVFGGRSSQTKLSKKIEVYSDQQNTWKLLQFKIHRGIENALIFSQSPNQVLIVGGATHGYACKTVIKINLKQQSYIWDSQLSKEYSHAKGVITGDDIFVFGGEKDTCEIFSQRKWKVGLFSHRKNVEIDELQDFSFTKESLVVKSAEIVENQVDVILKQQQVFFGTDDYPFILLFNKFTGKIQRKPVPLSLRLKKNVVVVRLPQKIYMLLGGSDKEQRKLSRSCFFYNGKSKTASQTLKMSEKKINFAAVFFKGQVYTFGGYNTVQNVGYVSCQKFNLKQQKWEDIRRLNKPKYKVFAEVINVSKIAVFGQQQKDAAIRQIQIYNTIKDQYETFTLKNRIPVSISMIYSLVDQAKIVILREDADNSLEEIEISQQKLRERYIEVEESNEQSMKIVNQMLENQQIQRESFLPHSLSQSLEKDEFPKNKITVIKPRMIEIKSEKRERQSLMVRQQAVDSSFQIQKVAQLNNSKMDSQSFDKKLIKSQKQMPNFEDDVYFSIDARSLQANLSSYKMKQGIIEKKQTQALKKHQNVQEIQLKKEKNQVQRLGGSLQDLAKQKYNIVKRHNQLYFFRQGEVVLYRFQQNERTKHKIQSENQLKLFQLS